MMSDIFDCHRTLSLATEYASLYLRQVASIESDPGYRESLFDQQEEDGWWDRDRRKCVKDSWRLLDEVEQHLKKIGSGKLPEQLEEHLVWTTELIRKLESFDTTPYLLAHRRKKKLQMRVAYFSIWGLAIIAVTAISEWAQEVVQRLGTI